MAEHASICMLSFNRIDFLRGSIASLANPGYPIEIIVGDDGSDAAVQRDLVSLLREGKISKLYMNPPGHNEGVGAMVNKLFSVASGDYLVKSDQDLLYQADAIGVMVNAFKASVADDPSLATLGGFRYWVDPVDHEKMLIEEWPHWTEVADYVSSCMMVPRYIWNHFGPWPEHSDAFAEDIEFKQKLRSHGYAHGLTKTDVIVNRGFGVGPSTVVVSGSVEEGHFVQPIHHGPVVFDAA